MYWPVSLLCLAGGVAAQFAKIPYQKSLPGNIQLGLQTVANDTTLQLSSITEEHAYTALTHPAFPAHQVRVKRTKFCDPTVKYVSQ